MKFLLLATLGVALLGACTSPPPAPTAPPADTIAPNANLVAQGIPPVPASVAQAVARYNDFRGHNLIGWHPVKRELLLSHRKAGASTVQLFRLASPMGTLEQLTDLPEPIGNGSYEPVHGNYLVYLRASGGDEAFQVWRLDLDSRRHVQISDPAFRHAGQGWLRGQGGAPSRLLIGSVPLDRTAQGGTRAEINTRLAAVDPLKPEALDVLATLPGGGWSVSSVSPDQSQLLLLRYISATNSEVWLLDVRTRERRRLLPAAGGPAASYREPVFSADGKSLFFGSDALGEFRELMVQGLDGSGPRRLSAHIPWDVGSVIHSDDGRWLAAQANEDGSDSLRLFDARTLQELPRPALPAGNVGTARFHRTNPELAFSLVNAQGPGQVFTLNPQTGRVEQWTRAEAAPGVDASQFKAQELIRWKSFDGRQISGWLSLPPTRFAGKRPVLIDIHGGPEGQAQAGFLGRSQYFVQELGIAYIRPNVRGSSGYGKTFVNLDNGMLREDSVKDIGALLDWIATQPHLDASRVVVSGGSYGGYMSLASAFHYADRLAGAIDVVGISHFATFLQNTESYRRDLRRVEYGDERDPAMRAFFDRIAPLANAGRITKPLFVVQGKNDPRVPVTEAEQIVTKARANGTPVWYLRAENEGHGFARKENADFQFYATIMFLRQTMGL